MNKETKYENYPDAETLNAMVGAYEMHRNGSVDFTPNEHGRESMLRALAAQTPSEDVR